MVLGIGTLTEYVDRELQPLLANILNYIKDTTDFLNKLSRFCKLPDNAILVTLIITALHSSIPHNDGIRACKIFWIIERYYPCPAKIPVNLFHSY